MNTVLVKPAHPDHRLDEIRSELKKDDTFKVVMHYVQYEWPEDKQKIHGPQPSAGGNAETSLPTIVCY